MKLIIDIPEEEYKAIKDYPNVYNSELHKAIANGTPYNPSGDLISREALKDITYINKGNFNTVEGIREWIDNAPTVEQFDDTELQRAIGYADGYSKGREERPQGEWVYRQEWFEDEKEPRMTWGCNQCGFSIKSVHEKRNFCPNCGAQMQKGDKE